MPEIFKIIPQDSFYDSWHFKKKSDFFFEFPLWCSGLIIWLVSVEVPVQSSTWCRGLRIQHCCSCGIVHTDLIPGPGAGEKQKKNSDFFENSFFFLSFFLFFFFFFGQYPWVRKFLSQGSYPCHSWNQSTGVTTPDS